MLVVMLIRTAIGVSKGIDSLSKLGSDCRTNRKNLNIISHEVSK